MNPADMMAPIAGIVAIVMIFAIPILAIVTTMVLLLVAIKNRNRERMKMIEQGIMPPPATSRRTGNFYALLITGAVMFALGIGLFVASLLSGSSDIEGGLIFGLIGLALLLCFVFIRVVKKRKQVSTEIDDSDSLPPATS